MVTFARALEPTEDVIHELHANQFFGLTDSSRAIMRAAATLPAVRLWQARERCIEVAVRIAAAEVRGNHPSTVEATAAGPVARFTLPALAGVSERITRIASAAVLAAESQYGTQFPRRGRPPQVPFYGNLANATFDLSMPMRGSLRTTLQPRAASFEALSNIGRAFTELDDATPASFGTWSANRQVTWMTDNPDSK